MKLRKTTNNVTIRLTHAEFKVLSMALNEYQEASENGAVPPLREKEKHFLIMLRQKYAAASAFLKLKKERGQSGPTYAWFAFALFFLVGCVSEEQRAEQRTVKSKYALECFNVQYLERCENLEVVCYRDHTASGASIFCFKKEKPR